MFNLKVSELGMIYTLTIIVTNDSGNQILQHKVLHNVLYINKNLQIYKIRSWFTTIQLPDLYAKPETTLRDIFLHAHVVLLTKNLFDMVFAHPNA